MGAETSAAPKGSSATASRRCTTSARPGCSIRPSSGRPSRCSRSSPATAARWSSRSAPAGFAAARRARRARRRHRQLRGDGGSPARQARSGADRGRGRRHGDDASGGSSPLVYLVFNTIFNLVTQDGQVACFENAGRASAQRRAVRDRGARARTAATAARPDRPAVAGRAGRDLVRRVRRRGHAAVQLASTTPSSTAGSSRVPWRCGTRGPPSWT